MPRTNSLLVACALLALLPGPSWAAEANASTQVASLLYDDLGLYLDTDQLVETASRYPKPLGQVAENVTVITAEEIEAQHAHTLGEVLAQVPGLFIFGFGQDVGSNFQILSQGSTSRHTLVLIDGVRLNTPSDGSALPHGLPLGIIKRIEIIKGPVSSSWGSSLGGVVNILTKDSAKSERPRGQATASLGERGTSEVNAQVAGAIGRLGYYLYGGSQETDGHAQDQWFDNRPLYAKLTLPLAKVTLGATIGTSDPYGKTSDIPSWDATAFFGARSTFSTLYLDAPLASGYSLHLAGSRFTSKVSKDFYYLGLDPAIPAGSFYWDEVFEDQNHGLEGRLSWTGRQASAVIGFESGRGQMDFAMQWPVSVFTVIPRAQEERRACFANATLSWGDFTFSPGLRYDYSSTSEEAVSPSLGATYRLDTETILRATLAQGFNAPYLDELVDSVYGNPDLTPEYVDSVQAGVETVAVPYLRLAANLFHHRVTDVWENNLDTGHVENRGIERRHGLEIEADTLPWRHLSLGAKAAVVSTDSETQESDRMYAANLIARYDRPELLSVRLAGRYIWWNQDSRREDGKFDDFIWDLALSREVYSHDTLRVELFGVVRNLFNGSQYWLASYSNPERWLEAGLTVKF